MAVLSFFGICFILAFTNTVVNGQDQTLESLCEAFPQIQICSSLSSTASGIPPPPSSTSVNVKNDVIKPMGYKASVLAKAFEPNRPSYMRFGKRDFEDELAPHSQGVYKKFGQKQKSSYMRFGKRSDAYDE